MAKSKKKNRDRSQHGSGNGAVRRSTGTPVPQEDQRSVALTVAWMLSTLATAAAVGLSALASILLRLLAGEREPSGPLAALPALLLVIALVTSLLDFALIPLVRRVRPQPPPRPVTVGAILIGLSPWVIVLVQLLL